MERELACFQIWGRIEHLGPRRFLAIASAVCAASDTPAIYVMTGAAASRARAISALDRLITTLDARVRAQGNAVAGVELTIEPRHRRQAAA